MEKNTIIELNNVSLGYNKGAVLDNVTLGVKRGDFIGIIGPNGSGKTTVLRALLGLLSPLSGTIYRDARLKYGYVKQRQFLDPIYPLSVKEIVLMGRYSQMGPFAKAGPVDRSEADKALETTGIADLHGRLFRELSEGQKQRALVARALVAGPDILLLDEPTNDLDIKGEERIMSLLKNIQREYKTTIIMVSHLLNVILNHAKSFLFLGRGTAAGLYDIASLCREGLLGKIYGIPLSIKRTDGKLAILTGGNNDDIS